MFVKRSWGQVPARKERQTFGSVIESWVLREEEDAPISCSTYTEMLVGFLRRPVGHVAKHIW